MVHLHYLHYRCLCKVPLCFRDLFAETSPVEQVKLLVYAECLMELLKVCPVCASLCAVDRIRLKGSCLLLDRQCINGHTSAWASQPMLSNNLPAGNMALAGSILFSGSSPVKALHMLDALRMPNMSLDTFGKIQRCYLAPAVRSVWSSQQEELLQERTGSQVHLGGDGRCCSPGHTAKYCSYSLMDTKASKILDTQLVQVSIINFK